MKLLGTAEAGETETTHLEKWEKKYGFTSLRAEYARKKKEKEKKALLAAGKGGGNDPSGGRASFAAAGRRRNAR